MHYLNFSRHEIFSRQHRSISCMGASLPWPWNTSLQIMLTSHERLSGRCRNFTRRKVTTVRIEIKIRRNSWLGETVLINHRCRGRANRTQSLRWWKIVLHNPSESFLTACGALVTGPAHLERYKEILEVIVTEHHVWYTLIWILEYHVVLLLL